MSLDRVECHISSGIGGFFVSYGTRALEKMIDDLPGETDAKEWNHGDYKKVTKGILERAKKFGKPYKVILGGHSYGCVFVAEIANELSKNGILVDYAFCIDPTAGFSQAKRMTLDKNVLKVDEFWATSGIPAMARKLTNNGVSRRQAVMSFVNGYDMDRYKLYMVPGGHIPCASNEIVRKQVIKVVGNLLK